jgi:hypothetical protein
MSIRYRTGNKGTIALTGTMTTGVTTAWVGHIVSIDPGEWTLGERDVSVLADTGFARRDPVDLATPNDISGVVRFLPTLGAPVFGNIETVTVTFPKQSTATTGTAANLAGKMFFSRFKFPELANDETMNSEFTLAATGESLAFTAETT